jgi:hypothetical protein
MTTLLAELTKKIETLPPEIQDEIARQILEDIENELGRQETPAQPQSKLEKLAEKALEESKAGRTKIGFDEL